MIKDRYSNIIIEEKGSEVYLRLPFDVCFKKELNIKFQDCEIDEDGISFTYNKFEKTESEIINLLEAVLQFQMDMLGMDTVQRLLFSYEEIDNEILFKTLGSEITLLQVQPYLSELEEKGLIIDFSNVIDDGVYYLDDADYKIVFISESKRNHQLRSERLIECALATKSKSKECLFWVENKLPMLLNSGDSFLESNLNHIIDYLNAVPSEIEYYEKLDHKELKIQELRRIEKENSKILKYSMLEIYTLADNWVNRVNLRASDEEDYDGIRNVFDAGNGFYFVHLKSEKATEREGKLMDHCVASHDEFENQIYSLRDSNNMPHVTIEVSEGTVTEIKGRSNHSVKDEYIPMVRSFLSEYLSVDFKKDIVGDLSNINYYQLEIRIMSPIGVITFDKILVENPNIPRDLCNVLIGYLDGDTLVELSNRIKNDYESIIGEELFKEIEQDLSDLFFEIRGKIVNKEVHDYLVKVELALSNRYSDFIKISFDELYLNHIEKNIGISSNLYQIKSLVNSIVFKDVDFNICKEVIIDMVNDFGLNPLVALDLINGKKINTKSTNLYLRDNSPLHLQFDNLVFGLDRHSEVSKIHSKINSISSDISYLSELDIDTTPLINSTNDEACSECSNERIISGQSAMIEEYNGLLIDLDYREETDIRDLDEAFDLVQEYYSQLYSQLVIIKNNVIFKGFSSEKNDYEITEQGLKLAYHLDSLDRIYNKVKEAESTDSVKQTNNIISSLEATLKHIYVNPESCSFCNIGDTIEENQTGIITIDDIYTDVDTVTNEMCSLINDISHLFTSFRLYAIDLIPQWELMRDSLKK